MTDPILARFGHWISRLDYRDIPADSLRAARYQVLNMVATLHGAAGSRETASLAAGLSGFSPAGGRSTVLATGQRQAPVEAALANAGYSMAQDFDDIVWMGHTCHSAVFASLAVAEHEGLPAEDFLTAVVVANEIGGRLGAACLLGPLNGQMWTFIHLVSAAAATARLLKLDPAQTTHALAISLAQPNFGLQPGFMTPTSKFLAASTPTGTGIQAAYFARAGMTGAPEIVEDRRGFWARFTYLPLPSMMEGLGDFWVMQTLTVKTFPGCHYFQTAVSAIDRIEEKSGRIDPAAISRVTVETTKLGIEATRFASEYSQKAGTVTPVNVNFDLGITCAIRLLAGRFTSEQVHPEWLAGRTPDIRRLDAKIKVVHTPELTLKTLAGLRAVPTGRRALASVDLRELPRIIRKYSEEYRSSLITPAEAAAWIRAIAAAVAQPRSHPSGGKAQTSAIPLFFPNRVTLEFSGGRTESARVDLPAGSFCSPGMEKELEGKFLRECGPRIGARNSERAFEAGLRLEETGLKRFVELAATPPAKPAA